MRGQNRLLLRIFATLVFGVLLFGALTQRAYIGRLKEEVERQKGLRQTESKWNAELWEEVERLREERAGTKGVVK